MNPTVVLTLMLVVGLCLALDRVMSNVDRCPDCGAHGGWHWPSCERVKKK